MYVHKYCRDTHLSSTRFGCDQMNLRFESSKGCVTCDMLRIGSLCVTLGLVRDVFLCIAFHDHKREMLALNPVAGDSDRLNLRSFVCNFTSVRLPVFAAESCQCGSSTCLTVS